MGDLILTLKSLVIVFFSLSISNVFALDSENIVSHQIAEKSNKFGHVVVIYADHRYLGGGSLIADNFVLTAANLFYQGNNFTDTTYEVYAGVTYINGNISGEKRQVHKIYTRSFISHGKYELENNIAVLKLVAGFNVDENPLLAILQLPSPSDTFELKKGVVAAFGLNKNFEKVSNLRFVNVTVDKKYLAALNGSISSTDKICYGEDGSILVVDNKAVGIVDGEYTCNDQRVAFTKVQPYIEFINRAMQDDPIVHTDTYKFYILPKD